MLHFFLPPLVLIVWTLIIMVVMYARRLPAMTAISKRPQDFIDNPELGNRMPKPSRWAADNFNHLHENPTLFYALMVIIFLTNQVDLFALCCAWGYVVTRMVHSVVQISSNQIVTRFRLFVFSAALLAILAIKTIIAFF